MSVRDHICLKKEKAKHEESMPDCRNQLRLLDLNGVNSTGLRHFKFVKLREIVGLFNVVMIFLLFLS